MSYLPNCYTYKPTLLDYSLGRLNCSQLVYTQITSLHTNSKRYVYLTNIAVINKALMYS